MAALQEVSKGKNFVVYTDGREKLIKVMNVRLSYPHFGAKRVEKDEETGRERATWNGVAMLSKSSHVEAKDAFMKLINEIMDNAPNDKGGKGVKIPPEYRCIKNGDDKEDENMHGHWLISFSDGNRRPAIRDQRGELILDESTIDEKFYGGCYGNVLIRPWFFNGKAKGSTKTYPKRICGGFVGAQFVKDGEPFGNGRIDDTDAWGAVDDSDDGMGSSSSADEDDDGL